MAAADAGGGGGGGVCGIGSEIWTDEALGRAILGAASPFVEGGDGDDDDDDGRGGG